MLVNASGSSYLYFSGTSKVTCVVQTKHVVGEAVWGARLHIDSVLEFLLLEGWLVIDIEGRGNFLHRLFKEKEDIKKFPVLAANYAKEEIKGFLQALNCKEIN
jgi:hypothetical protein